MTDPLTLPGWQEFNRMQWAAEPVEFHFAPRGPNGVTLDVVAYRDPRGRLVLPTMNPHWPVVFRPTNTDSPSRLQRQWSETAQPLVEEMLDRGTAGRIALPADVADPRPWLWAGFQVAPLFTFLIDFPFEIDQADAAVRQKVRKSSKAGFNCRLADDVGDVLACLRETEARKGFDHALTRESLRRGLDMLGRESLRLYVCYSPDGEPASARIVLHAPGGQACDLAAGTQRKYLSSGATQHLIAHTLADLQQAGAAGFNFCGANIQSVSPAKSCWGGRLVSHYAVEGFDRLPLRRLAGNFYRLIKNRRSIRKQRSSVPVAAEQDSGLPLAACQRTVACS